MQVPTHGHISHTNPSRATWGKRATAFDTVPSNLPIYCHPHWKCTKRLESTGKSYGGVATATPYACSTSTLHAALQCSVTSSPTALLHHNKLRASAPTVLAPPAVERQAVRYPRYAPVEGLLCKRHAANVPCPWHAANIHMADMQSTPLRHPYHPTCGHEWHHPFKPATPSILKYACVPPPPTSCCRLALQGTCDPRSAPDPLGHHQAADNATSPRPDISRSAPLRHGLAGHPLLPLPRWAAPHPAPHVPAPPRRPHGPHMSLSHAASSTKGDMISMTPYMRM